jgi:hypothetical protein
MQQIAGGCKRHPPPKFTPEQIETLLAESLEAQTAPAPAEVSRQTEQQHGDEPFKELSKLLCAPYPLTHALVTVGPGSNESDFRMGPSLDDVIPLLREIELGIRDPGQLPHPLPEKTKRQLQQIQDQIDRLASREDVRFAVIWGLGRSNPCGMSCHGISSEDFRKEFTHWALQHVLEDLHFYKSHLRCPQCDELLYCENCGYSN